MLFFKNFFILSFIFCFAFSNQLWASDKKEDIRSLRLGFYIGSSLNLNRMTSSRSDAIGKGMEGYYDEYYSTSVPFSSHSVSGDFYFGYLGRISDTKLVFGFEPYLTFCNNKNCLYANYESVMQSAQLKYKKAVGILFRCGYLIADDYLLYLAVGPDLGYFQYSQDEIPSAALLSKNKWIKGIRYGIGLEKQIDRWRMGIQTTLTSYESTVLRAVDHDSETDFFVHLHHPRVMTISIRLSYSL